MAERCAAFPYCGECTCGGIRTQVGQLTIAEARTLTERGERNMVWQHVRSACSRGEYYCQFSMNMTRPMEEELRKCGFQLSAAVEPKCKIPELLWTVNWR